MTLKTTRATPPRPRHRLPRRSWTHKVNPGDVGDVVFPCGYTVADDGDTLHLYYGAADTSIALATGSIRAMLDWLRDNQGPIGAE